MRYFRAPKQLEPNFLKWSKAHLIDDDENERYYLNLDTKRLYDKRIARLEYDERQTFENRYRDRRKK